MTFRSNYRLHSYYRFFKFNTFSKYFPVTSKRVCMCQGVFFSIASDYGEFEWNSLCWYIWCLLCSSQKCCSLHEIRFLSSFKQLKFRGFALVFWIWSRLLLLLPHLTPISFQILCSLPHNCCSPHQCSHMLRSFLLKIKLNKAQCFPSCVLPLLNPDSFL